MRFAIPGVMLCVLSLKQIESVGQEGQHGPGSKLTVRVDERTCHAASSSRAFVTTTAVNRLGVGGD